jgi:hypothetical protein
MNIKKYNLKFRIGDPIGFGDQVNFYLQAVDSDGEYFVVKPWQLFWEHIAQGEIVEPSFALSTQGQGIKEFLKKIQESIELTGVSIETQSSGELKATKCHLEDMRKLAFVDKQEMVMRLKVEKPEEE